MIVFKRLRQFLRSMGHVALHCSWENQEDEGGGLLLFKPDDCTQREGLPLQRQVHPALSDRLSDAGLPGACSVALGGQDRT